jgi:hypothetical protein
MAAWALSQLFVISCLLRVLLSSGWGTGSNAGAQACFKSPLLLLLLLLLLWGTGCVSSCWCKRTQATHKYAVYKLWPLLCATQNSYAPAEVPAVVPPSDRPSGFVTTGKCLREQSSPIHLCLLPFLITTLCSCSNPSRAITTLAVALRGEHRETLLYMTQSQPHQSKPSVAAITCAHTMQLQGTACQSKLSCIATTGCYCI